MLGLDIINKILIVNGLFPKKKTVILLLYKFDWVHFHIV